MAPEKEAASGLEWRIKVSDVSSEVLSPKEGPLRKVLLGLKALILGIFTKLSNFLKKAWDVASSDPRKAVHGMKVGLALTAVSFIYYIRPLYDGVGGNAMWGVMTVVVVFENIVGATLSKCLNRISGTSIAGLIAVGIHYAAEKSGENIEHFIMGISLFLFASAATFSRFIPSVKSRFDYGAMTFVLTFSLVSISDYRVEELFNLAQQRLATIIIGTALCIFISMFICPIWAGQELYTTITRNMDKLATSLDGCVADYFSRGVEEDSTCSKKGSEKNLLGYKCVLSSKASEESMANFARWEPAHGRFNFRHPWQQYVKIGAEMRSCAYCIEALNGCINSENKVPDNLKKLVSNICLEVSSNSSSVIKELGNIITTMKKSSSIDFLVEQMNSAVQDLQTDIQSLPSLFAPQALPEDGNPKDKKTDHQVDSTEAAAAAAASLVPPPLMDMIPLVTLASLLIEITSRIERLVTAVEELANLAQFLPVTDEKVTEDNKIVKDQHKEDKTINTLQKV